jgi:hypothetical protein
LPLADGESALQATSTSASRAIARLAPVTDFFGVGDEIWDAEDPVAALLALTAPLR